MPGGESGLSGQQQHAGILRHRGGAWPRQAGGRGTLLLLRHPETPPLCKADPNASLLLNDKEEELPPLSPPPTLSITEEILEFINQSRAREGLASINTEPVVRRLSFSAMSLP